MTPRFSGVAFGADDMETVSTVSSRRPTVLVSLHQELKFLTKTLLSMGRLLVGEC